MLTRRFHPSPAAGPSLAVTPVLELLYRIIQTKTSTCCSKYPTSTSSTYNQRRTALVPIAKGWGNQEQSHMPPGIRNQTTSSSDRSRLCCSKSYSCAAHASQKALDRSKRSLRRCCCSVVGVPHRISTSFARSQVPRRSRIQWCIFRSDHVCFGRLNLPDPHFSGVVFTRVTRDGSSIAGLIEPLRFLFLHPVLLQRSQLHLGFRGVVALRWPRLCVCVLFRNAHT